jgi:hypothetical protein
LAQQALLFRLLALRATRVSPYCTATNIKKLTFLSPEGIIPVFVWRRQFAHPTTAQAKTAAKLKIYITLHHTSPRLV